MVELQRPALTDSAQAWLVYADALQAAGDPRGELIALHHAIAEGADPGERDALVARHADALLGPLAPYRAQLEIAWRWSAAETVSVVIGPEDPGEAIVDALLRSPLAGDIQTLRLVGRTPTNADKVALGPAIARLREGLPATCTGLELVDERAQRSRILVSADYDPGDNLVDFGDLDPVWAIPQLERVRLYVADTEQVRLGTIDAPGLREFALLGLRWSSPYDTPSQVARTLAAARWPQLRRLALRVPETFTYSWPEQDGAYVRVDRYDEDNDYYDDYADDEGWREDFDWSTELGGLLTALHQTPIEELALISFASSATLLEALAEHRLPASLRVLDLSDSELSDEHVEWLVEHRSMFDSLERLVLRRTLIEDPSPLSALRPAIEHSSGGGAIYRFSVGME